MKRAVFNFIIIVSMLLVGVVGAIAYSQNAIIAEQDWQLRLNAGTMARQKLAIDDLGLKLTQAQTANVPAQDFAALRAEYYRGAWDTCGYFAEKVFGLDPREMVQQCNEFLWNIGKAGWYEQESYGYTAP